MDRLRILRMLGDKFNESYTYGPVGLTTRTVETEDADPGDNFDHWVLPDVFGGTTGLLAKVGTGAREPVFEHFDAFGVRAGTTNWGPDEDASRYRWRSQEGSETDDLAISTTEEVELAPPNLVYMQTRHYDPSLGRFIMADSIPMGAFSPQGLNRYAYCMNDPVNGTDATGLMAATMGEEVFGAVIGYLSVPFALGFLVGLADAFGINLRPLVKPIWSGFNSGLWASKGRICNILLEELWDDMLKNIALKFGMRKAGLGALATADTIAAALMVGLFAPVAGSAGVVPSYYAGFQAGFMLGLELDQ